MLASDAKKLYVSDSEQYIASVGSEVDTVIQIWSKTGEKLFNLNTYQI